MSHTTQPRASELKDLDEAYYPTLSKALPSNRRESIFSTVEEDTGDMDQLSHGLDRLDFEDATENLSENLYTPRPTERHVERDLPLSRPKPTHEDMVARAGRISDQVKHTKVDYRELKEKYLEGVALHNQLVEEMDQLKEEMNQLKIEKNRLEGTCNHQEDELARYHTLLYERGHDNSQSNSKLPPPSGSNEKTAPKSMKFPDPPVLTDGKDPDIDDWLVQMRGKLEANADHMPTERQQMVYVQSRVGGLAMKHIQPRLRADAMIRFVTAQEMFDHLEAIFGDPNRKLNSRNKYRSLRQGDRDFNTFWAEFQLLSADLDHNEATLIDDLVYKSHHTIQRQLATGDELPTTL